MHQAIYTIIGFIIFGIVCEYFHRGNLKREQEYRQKYVYTQLRIHKDKQRLLAMHHRDFEFYVAAFLQLTRKFQTQVTQASRDGGKDIIAHDGKETIYVEVKHWTGNVGRPHIQKLEGVMSADRIRKGFFITSSGFTKDAVEYAAKTNIELIDGNQLIREMLK